MVHFILWVFYHSFKKDNQGSYSWLESSLGNKGVKSPQRGILTKRKRGSSVDREKSKGMVVLGCEVADGKAWLQHFLETVFMLWWGWCKADFKIWELRVGLPQLRGWHWLQEEAQGPAYKVTRSSGGLKKQELAPWLGASPQSSEVGSSCPLDKSALFMVTPPWASSTHSLKMLGTAGRKASVSAYFVMPLPIAETPAPNCQTSKQIW